MRMRLNRNDPNMSKRKRPSRILTNTANECNYLIISYLTIYLALK